MKHNILSFIIILISIFPALIQAQENTPNDSITDIEIYNDTILLPFDQQRHNLEISENELQLTAPIYQNSMYSPFSMYGITPFYHSYSNWKLHEGFNASLGMSITFSPDKYAPSGVGFGQDAAFMYAIPVNNRLSFAGGLYATNMDWGRLNYRNVGIAAVAAFKLNEKITLYGYGNKSIMPQRSPMYYPVPNFSPDKFGGMINFKLGESSSISFGVEGIRNSCPYYFY